VSEVGARDQMLAREIFVAGANRAFGDVTIEDARAHAAELKEVAGWGPTMRVAPVAHTWRELSMAMEQRGAQHVRELDDEALAELAPRLWVVMPGAGMML
jgi:hypothetical protein